MKNSPLEKDCIWQIKILDRSASIKKPGGGVKKTESSQKLPRAFFRPPPPAPLRLSHREYFKKTSKTYQNANLSPQPANKVFPPPSHFLSAVFYCKVSLPHHHFVGFYMHRVGQCKINPHTRVCHIIVFVVFLWLSFFHDSKRKKKKSNFRDCTTLQYPKYIILTCFGAGRGMEKKKNLAMLRSP